jgi:DNA segregation ATPase FtsK/SpoIIIE, S-DNA-T family
MSNRKPRVKLTPKQESKSNKPFWRLDPDRWEEIAAIGIIILAALTALGAYGLSGGLFLDAWTLLLQSLFGWGIYLAPLLLLGLGVWLILDALDRTWNLGWERPLGIGLLYVVLLMVLEWISVPRNPMQQPGPFQGGGAIGWMFLSAVIGGFGEWGAALGIVATVGITLILLFNISLPEIFRRLLQLLRVIKNVTQQGFARLRPPRGATIKVSPPRALPVPPARPERPPAAPRIDYPQLPAEHEPIVLIDRDEQEDAPSPSIRQTAEQPAEVIYPPVNAHVIGESEDEAPVVKHDWQLPELVQILTESPETEINQQEIRDRVHKIEDTLSHFGVPAKVLEVNQGPAITQFGVEPGFVEQKAIDGRVHRVKVKVSRITALQHDLELALATAPIRIEAPVPGKSVVGIEVPNSQIAVVNLRGVMESEEFKKVSAKSKLAIALGQDVSGQPICASLNAMPHLLIAGATGSGKSVCVNAIIGCLLCMATPDDVRFVMVDPKRVELVNFNGIPHLREPVVVEMDKAVAALQGAVTEMDRRFQLFAEKGARNIEMYNHMLEDKPEAEAERLPFLIVIVDELADLMMIAAEQVEKTITRLAQMARATGIHLILATQRPSVDVVTGLIKANFPSRISFAVTSQIDSRVVLDTPGAEKLLGRGDLLYMASDSSKLLRLQGCFVSDNELGKLVTHWKDQAPELALDKADAHAGEAKDAYLQSPLWNNGSKKKGEPMEDELLPQAIETVRKSNRASVSLLQRKLRIGYSRSARLIELLEEKGIVGPDEGPTKGRAVLPEAVPSTERPSQNRQETANTRARRSNRTNAPAPRKDTHEEDTFSDWSEEDWADLDK